MAVKLIDALLGEHGAFNALFNSIEKLDDAAVELAQIENATAALAAELDSHAAFEEELLFPALTPHLADDALIAELHADHVAIRAGLERIEEARDIREAMDAVHQTLALARGHFRKEEERLYPLAHKILDGTAQSRLGEAWAAARAVETG
jgi:iron-sulfur cluster repair protein YtfE (RIC family)